MKVLKLAAVDSERISIGNASSDPLRIAGLVDGVGVVGLGSCTWGASAYHGHVKLEAVRSSDVERAAEAGKKLLTRKPGGDLAAR